MTLYDFVTAINAEYPFAHFAWAHAPAGTYGTWSEMSTNRERGTGDYSLRVSVELLTRDDSETPRSTMQAVFNTNGVPWNLYDAWYDDERGMIHYIWRVEVFDDA